MKKLIFILCFLTPLSGWALKGQVIVLEAPLFSEKNLNSPVTQYVRKGDIIYIHDFAHKGGIYDLDIEMDEKTFDEMRNTDHLKGETPISLDDQFYITLDRNGRTAYIPQKYVKLYYQDTRELLSRPFPLEHDETDYRLQEPLPRNYPLPASQGYRGSLTFGVGSRTQDKYNYTSPVEGASLGERLEFFGQFLKQFRVKNIDRLYLGGMYMLSFTKNEFALQDDRQTEEFWYRFALGPVLAYDAFQGQRSTLTLYGGIMATYETVNISQNIEQESDRRSFSTLHFFPRLGINYQKNKIFPEIDVDFVAGMTMDYLFARQYRSQEDTTQVLIWNEGEKDYILSSPTFQTSFYLGFQKNY